MLPFDDRAWRKLFAMAGREGELPPELITDRTADFDRLYGLLSDIIATRTSAEWMALLRAADIPAMPMNSLADLIDDPHLADVGFFQARQHPSEGEVRMMVVPDGVADSGQRAISPAPHLGEHSRDVLREAGLSDPEIEGLLAAGAVRQAAPAGQA